MSKVAEPIPGYEAYQMAAEAGKLGLESLNYFVLICLAIGGWVLTSKTILRSNRSSPERIFLFLALFASAGTLALGVHSLLDRATSAMTLARAQAEASDHLHKELLLELYKGGSDWAGLGLGATLAVVSAIIFVSKSKSQIDDDETP